MLKPTINQRQYEILQIAFGDALIALLARDDVLEIMANPDGKIWVDSLSEGKTFANLILPATTRANIIQLIASMHHELISVDQAEIACELENFSARFQGFIPPISAAPTFSIRKRARQIYTLAEYVANAWVTEEQAVAIKSALHSRANILIAGGTGSGKTTFANAILHELRDTNDRIIVLEDLPELQISSPDAVHLRTNARTTMRDLVKSSLRMRPDRIVIGEVRDGAALDLLKAWNTGHPGGLCTLHANRAESVIARLEDLIAEATTAVPQRLIAEAVDLILFMQKTGHRHFNLTQMLYI